MQSPTPADCRHARERFDCLFGVVAERRDIGPAAKLVHAHLVSLRRTAREATQAEIGASVGLSRHQVWRAVGELAAAGLVRTIRYGLGRPNGYVLLGLAADDLDGRASARPAPRQAVAGRPGTPARAYLSGKERTKETRYPAVRMSGFLESREGHYRDVVRR